MPFPGGNRPVQASPATSPQYYNDPGLATRRLQGQTQYAGRTTTTAWGAHGTAVADPNQALVGYKTGFQDTGRLLTGVVMDGTAIANCYRVHLDHGHCPMLATVLSKTGQGCLGATEITTIQPGARVVVMVPDKDNKAVILGVLPDPLDIGRRAFHDYISQCSRNRVDDAHKKYIKQDKSNAVIDYSSWRPYDATLAGEWGAISKTGIGVTVDDFMFKTAVNEFCGVYGFYHDSLLRVAGYNMQMWTAGSERDAYMDQAECNDATGYAPYPWEAVGVLIPGPPVVEEYEPGCFQCFREKPYYSHWENKHEFAQPYHRSQVFFGYLGQGMRQVVHAPPEGKTQWTYDGIVGDKGPTPFDSNVGTAGGFTYNCTSGPEKDTQHEAEPVFGLSEENKSLDGRIFMASAKGVHIAKRVLLPFPQRIKRPEDINHGDDASTNYKAAGKYGAGPDHVITGDIETTESTYPNLQRAAGVLDLHGYLYNYSGLHAFFWHENDYRTWEQQDLLYADVNQKVPPFGMLAGVQMYLKEETPKQFYIDHRYGTQNYYETESYISLLEDGGVVIGDGYGGEIRMTGGCVFITAPGDVWLKSGRDVQAWAGNDVIAKANKSVDISSTEKNVRIKAERNVLVFAGNETSDREGGILLESRAKSIEYDFEKCGDDVMFAGVVARAPFSNVVGLAKNIYLRTGGGEIEDGNITIDAAQARKDILTKSRAIYNFMTGAEFHFFGSREGQEDWTTRKSNMFSERFTLLCGPIGTDRDMLLDGNILARGSCLLTKGHIFTEVANRGFIFVAPCDEKCQGEINPVLDLIEDLVTETIPKIADQIHQGLFKELWYAAKRAGNERVMTIMEFSFRKDEDYMIPDFLLFEDRWQQMARLSGDIPDRWTERPVPNKICDKTYPFPGKKWLEDSPAYKEQDLQIAQYQDGGLIDKARRVSGGLADEYRSPQYKQPDEKTINGNYPIVPRMN